MSGSFGEILWKNGVEKTVAVQAHQSLAETFWLLDLSDKFEYIAGVVGWADLLSDDFERQLSEFVKHPKFKGIRHIVQDETNDHRIVQTKVLSNIAKLADYGLTYDILIFPRHLPLIPKVVESCPNVGFVIDHPGKRAIRSGAISDWRTDLGIAAEFPQVFCKLSGLATEADHQTWTSEDLRPFVATAIEFFGTERSMFGNDFPVCLLASDYRKVLKTNESFFDYFDEHQKQRVFRGNAVKFYNLNI